MKEHDTILFVYVPYLITNILKNIYTAIFKRDYYSYMFKKPQFKGNKWEYVKYLYTAKVFVSMQSN